MIDIIGTGKSLMNYEWPTDRVKWSVASAFDSFQDRIDLYFCMHEKDPEEKIKEAGIETISKFNYPLNDIIAEFDSHYFTNSISYMIAYAIFKGEKEINLIGIDLAPYSEYAFERPSISFWCGIAKERGVKINFDLIEPHVIYGYTEKVVADFIMMLRTHRDQAIAHREQEEDQDKHHQWTGYIAACNMLEREVKS